MSLTISMCKMRLQLMKTIDLIAER